jgi:hypothetical protein
MPGRYVAETQEAKRAPERVAVERREAVRRVLGSMRFEVTGELRCLGDGRPRGSVSQSV